MKGLKVYIMLVSILFLLGCEGTKRVDWYPYFESQYKKAFGTEVFRKELEKHFPETYTIDININTEAFIKEKGLSGNSTYLYINPQLYQDKETISALLDFCRNGNSLFIAAQSFNDFSEIAENLVLDKSLIKRSKHELKRLSLGSKTFEIESKLSYAYYFSSIPENATALGYVKLGDSVSFPDLIKLELGNPASQVFLHANPYLFTNYHMLNGEDGFYALTCLSYLEQDDSFYWDGNSTRRRYTQKPSDGNSVDLLRYIFSNESLRYAFLLLFATIVIFLSFNYKRIVKVMPVFEKDKNTTLSFIRTMAAVFRNEKNHIDLAHFRINYILEQIRTRYYLNTTILDEDFISRLAAKADLKAADIEIFVRKIRRLKEADFMDQEDFYHFCQTMEKNIDKLKLHGND